MARKNYVLFDNYNDYDFDEIKKEMETADECEYSDDYIWFVIYNNQSEDWDNMRRQLEDDFGDSQLLVVGTVGLWDGNFAAGKLCKDTNEIFLGTLTDCDYKKVWYEKGHLYIMGSHHDGTNWYEIKKVTDRGLNYYDNWNYSQDHRIANYSEREIHERMWKSSKYTHLV